MNRVLALAATIAVLAAQGPREAAAQETGGVISLAAETAVVGLSDAKTPAAAAGKRPPAGLCLPVRYRRARDGDTIEVSFRGSTRRWAIRLAGIDAPELRDPGGREAKAAAERLCQAASDAGEFYVFVPAPRDWENLLANLTFDRVPARLWIDAERTLGDALVDMKLAARIAVKDEAK